MIHGVSGAATVFVHINLDWNAEPHAPAELIACVDRSLRLSFTVDPWAYQGFREGERMAIAFSGCRRYRLRPTNDEGWYCGQCRFSHLAPSWGEFYEIAGDLKLAIFLDD